MPGFGWTGGGGAATSALGGGTNWWSRMSPEVQSALVSGGLALGGGLLQGYGQSKQADADREAAEAQTELGVRSRNVDRALELALNREASGQRGREAAAGMMGSSPLAFQQDRNRMALMRAILGGEGRMSITPPADIASSMGQVQLPQFSPEALRFMEPGAMASAEAPYWNAVSSLNPNLPSPDLGAAGYGAEGSKVSAALEQSRATEAQRQSAERAGNDRALGAERQALMQALDQDSTKAREKRKGGGGGSTWKTLANIGIGLGTAYLGGKMGGGGGGGGWF